MKRLAFSIVTVVAVATAVFCCITSLRADAVSLVFNAQEPESAAPAPQPWKTRTIQLGTFESTEALRTALVDAGYRINCDEMLDKVVVAAEPTEASLIRATVAELGFPDGATIAQIYEAGLKRGWQLCPAEVGPQLRLQYPNQPHEECDFIAMEPMELTADPTSGHHLGIFGVEQHDVELYLHRYDGNPVGFWGNGDDHDWWVFLRK